MSKKKAKPISDLGLPPGGGEAQELVHIRATGHLPSHPSGYLPALSRGGEALVDPNDPWIQAMLGGGWMIPLGEPDELPRGERP